MRTTLNIDEKLLDDVLEATGEKTKSKAVNRALGDYIRRVKIAELRAMAGKIDIVDNWRELEEIELNNQEGLKW